MRQENIWDVDAAQRYDTPGAGMFAPEVIGPTVDRLVELAGDGRALELAIGSGRVAVPLAERGVPVTGIELSRPMIDQLRSKVDDVVRQGEEAEWTRSNPEARARAEATVAQLRTSIANLEADAEKARASGQDKKAADAESAAATRRTWLVEAEKTLTEFS